MSDQDYLIKYSPLDIYWRSIILFGRNVATYKFALAQSLLELSTANKNVVRLEELAKPFSMKIVDHLRIEKKQGTFQKSKYLDSCQKYIDGVIDEKVLIEKTVQLGFINVIDAFHNVNSGEIPKRFFIDERKSNGSIRLTDNIFSLRETSQYTNLPFETEARWKLVETAWSLRISPRLLVVKYDPIDQELFLDQIEIRKNVTSCRDALNGYQKGKCFYCSRDIILKNERDLCMDIDHFFPNTLKKVAYFENIKS